MPFYEYECPSCRYYIEVLQKVSDKPLKKCPSCGKGGLTKLVSAPVFRLKGAGWYETDFKSDQDNKRNLAGADREESSGDAKTEAGKVSATDAKSDAKADAKADAKGGESKGENKAGGKVESEGQSGADKSGAGKSRAAKESAARSSSARKSTPKRPAARAAKRPVRTKRAPSRGGKRR